MGDGAADSGANQPFDHTPSAMARVLIEDPLS